MSEHNSLETSSLLKSNSPEHPLANALDEAMNWSKEHKAELLLTGAALSLGGALVSGRALMSSSLRKEGGTLAKESALDFSSNPLDGLLNNVAKPNSAASRNLLNVELQHDPDRFRVVQRLSEPISERPRGLWDFEGVKQQALKAREQMVAGADQHTKIRFIPEDKLPQETQSLQELLKQLDPKDLRASRNFTHAKVPLSAERKAAFDGLEQKFYEQPQPNVVKSRIIDGVEQIKK
ncbi:MAG: hypothetical protein K2X81_15380 [Candidatus Obscuribacterales bacterium]|nr:hypothetical protein [Candidatus Obscuribacterales bacterium]